VNTLGYCAVGAGLAQALLIALVLAHARFASTPQRLYGLLMAGVAGYLLIPVAQDWPGAWLLGPLSTLVPGVFWLFSESLFDDQYELSAWQLALVALSVLMPGFYSLLVQLQAAPAGEWAHALLVGLPQLLEFGFLVLALKAILGGWRDDLVAPRRKLRFWFAGFSGVFIFVLVLAREILFKGAPWLPAGQYLATALALTGANALLLRFVPGLLEPVRRRRPAVASSEPERGDDSERQLQAVRRLLDGERLYREGGLTIGRLASASGLPEYRLRLLINRGLGYRNFNEFLNEFRIDEASRRLADPAEGHLPVLTIALDVGFRSISTFNKAFREAHATTPTAWRRQHLDG